MDYLTSLIEGAYGRQLEFQSRRQNRRQRRRLFHETLLGFLHQSRIPCSRLARFDLYRLHHIYIYMVTQVDTSSGELSLKDSSSSLKKLNGSSASQTALCCASLPMPDFLKQFRTVSAVTLFQAPSRIIIASKMVNFGGNIPFSTASMYLRTVAPR